MTEQPRGLITHADAEAADQAKASEKAVTQRSIRQREVEKLRGTRADQFFRSGAARVGEDGGIEQSFSCHCSKPGHDHASHDDRSPFEAILEPTVVEFLTTDEAAETLAQRVNSARTPQTPPAASLLAEASLRSGRSNPPAPSSYSAGGFQRGRRPYPPTGRIRQ